MGICFHYLFFFVLIHSTVGKAYSIVFWIIGYDSIMVVI